MKEYLQDGIYRRVEDYKHNNPNQEPTHIILHPTALAILEIVPVPLQLVCSSDIEVKEVIVY